MNGNINLESLSAPVGSDADPVDWEARYRAGDTPWNKGRASPALTDFLASHIIGGEVLVPGSGLGEDVRALAEQGAAVVGLDLAITAVRLARSIPPSGLEVYEQGDLFHLPTSWAGRFEWVVEHTCFCAIPPGRRSDYVKAIASVMKPNGHYFAVFYLNPAAPEGPPHGITREEIAHLFDPRFQLLEEWIPSNAFAGREGRELCQLRRIR